MKTEKALPRILAVTLICALAVPLVNTAVVRSLGIYFAADPLTYGYTLTDALGYIYNFINIISTFAVSGCIAYSAVTKRNCLAVMITAVISLAAVYAAGIVGEVVIDSHVIAAADIVENLLNFVIETVRYGVVLAAALLTGRRAAKKGEPLRLEVLSFNGALSRSSIVTALCVAVMVILSMGIETFMLVYNYGAPTDFSEIMELVMPYITVLIYSILGYFACYAVMLAAKKPAKAAQEEHI